MSRSARKDSGGSEPPRNTGCRIVADRIGLSRCRYFFGPCVDVLGSPSPESLPEMSAPDMSVSGERDATPIETHVLAERSIGTVQTVGDPCTMNGNIVISRR